MASHIKTGDKVQLTFSFSGMTIAGTVVGESPKRLIVALADGDEWVGLRDSDTVNIQKVGA
jgi:hypothetical protein